MISDIRLQQFRSYNDALFEFGQGVNIIVGPNASGKTNLLEAIRVVCSGSSYRSQGSELIMANESWSRIDMRSSDASSRTAILKLTREDQVEKTYDISGKRYKRLRTEHKIPLVLFEPNHLLFLTKAPELRREFMDDLLESTVQAFLVYRRQYKRVLTQRNALLKQGSRTKQQLFAWNVRLSELGGKIAEARQELIQSIAPGLQNLYRQLSKNPKSIVRLNYITSLNGKDYTSALLNKLETSTRLDYERGFTSYGPHRDDLKIFLNGHPAASIASRGEIRTLLLGLKLLELEMIEKSRGEKPILLLDDVFGELDGARRRSLTEFLRGHQSFITTTDADIVVHHFIGKAHIIPLGGVRS